MQDSELRDLRTKLEETQDAAAARLAAQEAAVAAAAPAAAAPAAAAPAAAAAPGDDAGSRPSADLRTLTARCADLERKLAAAHGAARVAAEAATETAAARAAAEAEAETSRVSVFYLPLHFVRILLTI